MDCTEHSHVAMPHVAYLCSLCKGRLCMACGQYDNSEKTFYHIAKRYACTGQPFYQDDTMRKIYSHEAEPDRPIYTVTVPDGHDAMYRIEGGLGFRTTIKFQNKPIKEGGVNGVSIEILLAIAADRLRGFQDGKYSCVENQYALDWIERALRKLHQRTKVREERGVEGTSEV